MQDLGYNLENLDGVIYITRIEQVAYCDSCDLSGCAHGCTNGCGTCRPGCPSGGVKE